ncbi:MAG TPA: hypothetical protein VIJ09_05585 [Acidimicrobiales bacterium]
MFTANGGRTWSSLRPPGQLTDVSLGGPILWVIANSGPTLATTDGGATWRTIATIPAGS